MGENFYSMKYFCNARVGGLGEIYSPVKIFPAVRHYVLAFLVHWPRCFVLLPVDVVVETAAAVGAERPGLVEWAAGIFIEEEEGADLEDKPPPIPKSFLRDSWEDKHKN